MHMKMAKPMEEFNMLSTAINNRDFKITFAKAKGGGHGLSGKYATG